MLYYVIWEKPVGPPNIVAFALAAVFSGCILAMYQNFVIKQNDHWKLIAPYQILSMKHISFGPLVAKIVKYTKED